MYAVMEAGSVAYSKDDAALDIDELIEALKEAKRDGATQVVGLSGNYRGAKYVILGLPEVDDNEYDEDED